MSDFPRSHEYWQRASQVLAGGVSSSIRLAEPPHPMFFRRAAGAEIEDLDGRRYIDYVCGYGPVILGHGDPRVTGAVAESLARGQAYGGQHLLEIEVAEAVREAVPSMEMMRFSSTGSEAVHAAIRIARAHTGRTVIARFDGHYHGWLDTIFTAALPAGQPLAFPAAPGSRGQAEAAVADVAVLPWNDAAAVAGAEAELRGRLAGVILEPILCNTGVVPPRAGFVEALRAWCDREGAVLIFDEVITGFRVGLGGAQAALGVRPDLSVFAKAIANGFPISAVGGRRDLMKDVATGQVLHAGTFNGNVATLAAAHATLETLRADGGAVYQTITATGRALMDGLRRLGKDTGVPLLIQGPGPVFHLWFTDLPAIDDVPAARAAAAGYNEFAGAMLRRGVRVIPGGRWYLTASHTIDHVTQTLAAAREALADVAQRVSPGR